MQDEMQDDFLEMRQPCGWQEQGKRDSNTKEKMAQPCVFRGFSHKIDPVLCQKMQNRNALFMRFVDRATNKCKMKCKMKFGKKKGSRFYSAAPK